MNQGVVKIVLALAALAVVATAVGCGSGSDSSMTKGEFLKKGKAICLDAERERAEAFATAQLEAGSKGLKITKRLQEQNAVKGLRPYEKATQRLAELSAPSGDEVKIQELIVAMEEGVRDAKADPSVILQSDGPFRKANKMAEAYGLGDCVI